MSQSYLLELLERAFLLQQKRIWSLEQLLKIERGQILTKSSPQRRQRTVESLNSNLRIAKECLNDVARASGYESTIAKLLDPSFVIGSQITPTVPLQQAMDKADMAEQEAGVQHLAAMCRELAVTHEPYFQSVHERIRKDVEFYDLCRDLELLDPSKSETPPDDS